MDETGEPWAEGASKRGRPGVPVDPYRLRRALWGNKFKLLGAGVLGVVVGVLVVKLIMSSSYQTTAVLRYEGDMDIPGVSPSGYGLSPAADALKRQAVLRKIREEGGFDGSLRQLSSWIDYEMNLEAGTLEITVAGETAEDAAEFARIVTDVFMTYHKDRQSRRIEDEITRTRKRIDAAETEAEKSRSQYNAFREAHGIADLSTEQTSMVKSATTLRADSELAVSNIRALEAQVRSLEQQLASTPKTSLVSGGGSPERAAYNRLRGELASAKATLSPDHPRVQALQQQVDQLGAQLRAGGASSSSGAGLMGANKTYQVVQAQLRTARSNLEAARERQKGLREMADKAQHRVEAFSNIEGEASGLLAEVKVNENLLSDLRHTQALLEDALRDPPSGFVVLDPGAVPEYPVRNKMKTVVFLAISAFSFAFASFLVLRREFRGLQAQTPSEVAFWGSGPVLAATSWPDDPYGLDELVAGLDDVVPHARGSLLILGASPAESRIANELANRMNHDWFLTDGGADTPEPAPIERGPLQTPPPSGPYPIRRSGAQSVALAPRPSSLPVESMHLARPSGRFRLEAWDGPQEGQALRRAARLANRVVVLVHSGAMSALRLNRIQRRIGRQDGIGYIVVGLPSELDTLPDRVGDVATFWQS